ncbi:ABC transporter substrate-binding protein [Candidatus Aerophobetes bacterium]|uniref:Probable sugar-binding periplasmic protein n=1 Tax=Aerophobetes bacterium TaxID=2030807 RepID=A0A662DHA5_UNCAE|nr:MAG: ABC transporter substrate-binding protein [Candidatus Aerophobetes bacterium]
MQKKFIGIALTICIFLFAGLVGLANSSSKLIIYHWWTAGGEKEAIDSVFNKFNQKYPDIEIVENPIAGGGGGIMRAQIKTMIMAGQSPDTFQLTYGTGMIGSFAEVLDPIDDLWKDFPVPAMVKKMGTIKNHQYGIPLNIMRNNCLWYNKAIIDKLGIAMPLETLYDFYIACEKVKNAGYIPYAVGAGGGQKFWWVHIAEQFLLGLPHGGPEYITKLYGGKADPANDPAIRELLEALRRLVVNKYINSDYAALTWDQAADLLMTNKAAFYQMGDWAKGHFTSAGWKPKVDFDYQPSPGTSGYFTLHLDCFVLPKGAPHRDAAIKWLKFLKTVEAETAFCPIKGATPPRLDAPIDMYDAISKDILNSFRNPKTKIVQSAWAQPPEAWLDVYGDMLSAFVIDPDVEKGVKDFASAYKRVFGFK